MSVAVFPLQSPAPPMPGDSDFLGQCAALGMALLERLQTLVKSPCAESPNSSAAYQRLDGASRILKRIQETYLSGQKAMDERGPQPARKPMRAAALESSRGLAVGAIAPESVPLPVAIPPEGVPEASPSAADNPKTDFMPSPVVPIPAEPIHRAVETPCAEASSRALPSLPKGISAAAPEDAMDSLLASVAALEARYAAPSAASPLVARLVERATSPDPSLFNMALSPLPGISHPGSGTPTKSAAGKKRLIHHKAKKKR